MSAGVGMNSCCLSGKVQEGKPTGKEEEINGMQTYVAAPENGDKSKTIIFLVDSKYRLRLIDRDIEANTVS